MDTSRTLTLMKKAIYLRYEPLLGATGWIAPRFLGVTSKGRASTKIHTKTTLLLAELDAEVPRRSLGPRSMRFAQWTGKSLPYSASRHAKSSLDLSSTSFEIESVYMSAHATT
ncbi:hypothetical protein HGRIS_014624 [Hohenbuehelia grisea]|uniref:Uncharacterized protein n=1 Tax=Hohenbuehelia grisea TaxID=104357 RepID=A0ABR3JU63_9AGAR